MTPEERAPQPLSEAEAWREIARRMHGDENHGGPFLTLVDLRRDGRIGYELYYRMWDRGGSFFPHAREMPRLTVDERVLGALWLALEADDESRSALRSSGPGRP